MKKWYVFTTDGLWDCFGDNNPYFKKQDAIFDLTCACDDGRKRPNVKRIDKGFYEYISPSGGIYFIGKYEYLIENNYEWIIEKSE